MWGRSWAHTSHTHRREHCRACRSGQTRCAAAAKRTGVAVDVEPAPSNGRCLFAGVDIIAPPDVVWQALTDYDGLDRFIPGLAENRCLSRHARGARLLQIAEQPLALGAKFRARVVLDIEEYCGGIPAEQLWQASAARAAAERRNGNGATPEQRFLEPRSPLRARPRDIAFCLVEGDFQAFRGVWRIQEGAGGSSTARLSYALFVRPQIWLPVRLIQGRVEGEVRTNLAAVREHSERVWTSQRSAGCAA
ncbi:hypothetical protein WJX81_006251 [Elliptochloris bilobata]|uniref:Coenzyme Q-binding protein COQ10 START domain-containing protein n=1 Tax=Elliptochloris bilobata TaxID=381761 RepID=A0AAW1QMZ9_9CHLO